MHNNLFISPLWRTRKHFTWWEYKNLFKFQVTKHGYYMFIAYQFHMFMTSGFPMLMNHGWQKFMTYGFHMSTTYGFHMSTTYGFHMFLTMDFKMYDLWVSKVNNLWIYRCISNVICITLQWPVFNWESYFTCHGDTCYHVKHVEMSINFNLCVLCACLQFP